MRVEFLRSWRRHVPGSFMDPGDGVAEVLIRRGIVRAAPLIPEVQQDRKPVTYTNGRKRNNKRRRNG